MGKIPILTHIFQMSWNHQLVYPGNRCHYIKTRWIMTNPLTISETVAVWTSRGDPKGFDSSKMMNPTVNNEDHQGQNPHLVPFFLKVPFVRDDIQRLLEPPSCASLPGCLTPSWTYCLRSPEKQPSSTNWQPKRLWPAWSEMLTKTPAENHHGNLLYPWWFPGAILFFLCFAIKDMVHG